MKAWSKVTLTLAAGFIFLPAASPHREDQVAVKKITY